MEQAKKKIIRKVKPAAAMPRLERVAAYCRVSSGKDAMLHSLSAQVSHYSELIQRRPGWAYAGVYADEALTGTKDDRPEFQRLLADCRAGKIDRVLTKSVSRFARTAARSGTVQMPIVRVYGAATGNTRRRVLRVLRRIFGRRSCKMLF